MWQHDALSGPPNRVLLNGRLQDALARSKRGGLVATHMLDLDHFKQVNDTLGHPAGDKLLQMAAQRLLGLLIAPIKSSADLALYRAKGDSRGTYRFFEQEMDTQMQARRALEGELRRALAAQEFKLHYQLVVDLATNDISGFEH